MKTSYNFSFLTRYVDFIVKGDAGKLHPFSVLSLVLHLCHWQLGDLQPAAPERVQAGDSGDEAFVFSAASNDQEYLGEKVLLTWLGSL